MPKITPQVRQAVYDADCAEYGHLYSYNDVMDSQIGLEEGPAPSSRDDLKFPYVECTRCHRVWLVMPISGMSYEDAERLLYSLLNPRAGIARLITRIRGRREEREKNNGKAQQTESEAGPKGPSKRFGVDASGATRISNGGSA